MIALVPHEGEDSDIVNVNSFYCHIGGNLVVLYIDCKGVWDERSVFSVNISQREVNILWLNIEITLVFFINKK